MVVKTQYCEMKDLTANNRNKYFKATVRERYLLTGHCRSKIRLHILCSLSLICTVRKRPLSRTLQSKGLYDAWVYQSSRGLPRIPRFNCNLKIVTLCNYPKI